MLAVVQSEVDQLDAMESGPQTIEGREAALKKVYAIFTIRSNNYLWYDFHEINKMLSSLWKQSLKRNLCLQHKSVFHPRHALLLSLKHVLGQLYGRVEGYTLNELPNIILQRKIEFCTLVLDILNIIAPGGTRMRGKQTSFSDSL